MTISDNVVEPTDVISVNFSGLLPDGGCEGDFVRVGIPAELAGLAGTFPVKAPDGSVIGTMVVSGGAAVMTFNDYVESHVHVTFRGRLEVRVRLSVEPDTEYDLEWHAGSEVFVTPVTTVPCPNCGPDDIKVRKFAEYNQGPPPYIRFAISTVATQSAGESIVITDSVGGGHELNCSAIAMLMGNSVDAWGRIQFDNPWNAFSIDSCTATDLRVSLTSTAAGQYFRLLGRSTPTTAQDSYSDSATVTQSGRTTAVNAHAELADGDASGEGIRRSPSVDIEKWSTEDGPIAGDFDDEHKVLRPGADERLSFTIVNDGNEALVDIEVSDRTTDGTGTVRGLTCNFAPLGGPDSGTRWSGPLEIDESFICKGRLPALGKGARHTDRAKVAALGKVTDTPVADADDWNGKTRKAQPVAPESPDVDIEKWSTNDGPRAGDYDDGFKQLLAGVPEKLSFRVTNTGDEALVDLSVRDRVIRGTASVTGLACDFSDAGGPRSGTTWAGPLRVGDSFECAAVLSALDSNQTHIDRGSVQGTGADSGEIVSDTDDWGGTSIGLPLTGGPPGDTGPTPPLLPLVGATPSLAPVSGLAVLLILSGIWLIRRRTNLEG